MVWSGDLGEKRRLWIAVASIDQITDLRDRVEKGWSLVS